MIGSFSILDAGAGASAITGGVGGSPYRNGDWPMCSHYGLYCVYIL